MALTFEHWNSKTAERFKKFVPERGIDGFLGIRIENVEPGKLIASFEVTDEMITMIGNMHGGCLSAFCDHVLGVVLYPVMPEGSWAATTEFKINLLKPVSEGTCTATAEVISMTRTTAVVRIDVSNGDRLVAAAQGTCLIMAPKS
ncbi:MAG TPA: phenylacetic acid degradation protein [Acidimicrobiaceae bacterium]|nr:phenylacetic acid degradation protein [Acidimicrobiaceae bacterium]|tara:strand:+ start:388 stop:822 length:435 start_codon:yes stop_codon:yes gene_type:complete